MADSTIQPAEVAALRKALRPFSEAYTPKLDALGDVVVQVFVDPLRPEHSRSVLVRDFARARQALRTYSSGAEIAIKLESLESELGLAARLLTLWLDDDAEVTAEDLREMRRLVSAYAIAPKKDAPR